MLPFILKKKNATNRQHFFFVFINQVNLFFLDLSMSQIFNYVIHADPCTSNKYIKTKYNNKNVFD